MSEITRSVEIGKLVGALCKAQLAFDPILKESENPAFVRKGKASKYADMFSLVSATRKHLNNNGLTIMQFPTVTIEGKTLVVTTILAHESGEFVSHELLIPAADERGFTAHSIGKAMTYARRYSWGAITGAVAEDDDDGNDASGVGSREAAQALAKEKIAALRASNPGLNGNVDKTDSTIYYSWHNESQTATITGPDILLKLHKPYLKQFWNPGVKALVMNAEQLENAKYEFEQRKVPFAPTEGYVMAIRWDEFKANFKHYDSILSDNEPIVLPRREAARRAVNREKRSKIQFDCTPEQYALFHAELKRIREQVKNITMATDVLIDWIGMLTPELIAMRVEEFNEAQGRPSDDGPAVP